MKHFAVKAIPTLAMSLLTIANVGLSEPGTPAEQYATVHKEYQAVSAGMREAKTDSERKAHVERIGKFPPRFLALAEAYPDDPITLKALKEAIQIVNSTDSAALNVWEMNRSDFPEGNVSADDSIAKAVGLLLRDHLHSDKIGPIVDRVRFGYRMGYEEFLESVLRENPHRSVQALACLSLAQYLSDKMRMLRLAEDRAELQKRYEIIFGKDFIPELKKRERAGLSKQIESLFERADEDYADVEFRAGTVGEQARRELHDLRHLTVGKEAPDIEGKDQDGESFKLSDYRGKVVLLYFWVEF